jgi:predicted RecB family nuclease
LHGNNNTTIVKSDNLKKEFLKALKLIKSNTSPNIFLNKNCNVCEFNILCYEKALNDDNLSLLRGIPKQKIVNLNKKGIFTVHQYSFTFKPKKKQINIEGLKLDYSLKALALKEKKTYVNIIPNLPKAETKIFIDIEGLNDEDFYYLIGVHVEFKDRIEKYSFWSDFTDNVENEFIAFLNIFENITDYVIYHYGSYDITVLKKLNKLFGSKYSAQIELLIKNSFNILSLFSTHIYPPTYSNGLKEIANKIGFKWTSDNASGIQSIVWRKQWELTNNDSFKQLLITYNQEDCFALKLITEWINRIEVSNGENIDNCISVNSIKIDTYLKWGKQKFLIPELETINNYSYFDYQRSKIFLRTNKRIKKAINSGKKRKLNDKINKIINYVPIDCPMCGNSIFFTHNNHKTSVIDIKFTENGIKK